MKKKIICIAVIAIALTASWNIKQSKSEPNKCLIWQWQMWKH